MAAEKTSKRKQKTAGGSEGGGASLLRLTSDPRKERRYEPKASATAVVSVVGLSVGAVLLGAGTFGQWLRDETPGPHPVLLGPHAAAPWLLLAGALLLIAIALFGPRAATAIRVGDAGIGREREGIEVERIEWRDVSRLVLGGDALTVESPGTHFVIPLRLHGPAVTRILAEARGRIPARVEDIEESAFPQPDNAEGEVLPLEKPQLAGSRCKATDKLIAFEKDARLCGRCGEVYHKEAVPPQCLTCDAKLK